jgi:hypothetical protein
MGGFVVSAGIASIYGFWPHAPIKGITPTTLPRLNCSWLNDDDEQDVLGLRTGRGHLFFADSEPGLVRRLSTFTMQLSPGGVVVNL